MSFAVLMIGSSDQDLIGEMVSLYDPPRFWKVLNGSEIYCICTTEEHASSVQGWLAGIKSQEALDRLRSDLDKTLNHQFSKGKVILARCANELILRGVRNALDRKLELLSGGPS